MVSHQTSALQTESASKTRRRQTAPERANNIPDMMHASSNTASDRDDAELPARQAAAAQIMLSSKHPLRVCARTAHLSKACQKSQPRTAREGPPRYLVWKVKLNMGGAPLHGGQDLRGGGACDGVDLLYLVHLIGAREERKQTDHLQQGDTMPSWQRSSLALHRRGRSPKAQSPEQRQTQQ